MCKHIPQREASWANRICTQRFGQSEPVLSSLGWFDVDLQQKEQKVYHAFPIHLAAVVKCKQKHNKDI